MQALNGVEAGPDDLVRLRLTAGLRVLHGTSAERAHVIGELFSRREGRALAELLADLEANEDMRARLEIELMRRLHKG